MFPHRFVIHPLSQLKINRLCQAILFSLLLFNININVFVEVIIAWMKFFPVVRKTNCINLNTLKKYLFYFQFFNLILFDLKTYPLLSSYFATSTTKFFKPVLSFISSFKPFSILLDTGCGDCKYIHHFQAKKAKVCFLGQDNCKEMLTVDKYGPNSQYRLIQSDICNLALR